MYNINWKTNDLHLGVSADEYCTFGQNKFAELIHGRPSMLPYS